MHLFLKDWNLEFWVSNTKNIRNAREWFCRWLNFTSFGVFGFCFSSNLLYSRSLQTFAAFDPKWRNMTSLKHHFVKNFATDFPEIFVEDIRLMPDKVLKVLRRYLLSFLSYRENERGWYFSSSLSAARGKVRFRFVFTSSSTQLADLW